MALDIFEILLRDHSDWQLRILATHGGAMQDRARTLAPLRVLEPAHRRWGHSVPLGARLRLRGRQLSVSPFLRAFAPDLIYANSIESLHLLRYVSLPDAPILCHVHELDSFLKPFVTKCPQLLMRPQKFIAVADCVAHALTRVGIGAEKIDVVPAFVPDDLYHATSSTRTSTRKHAPASKRVFVVGGAGTPVWRKGFSLWLQMALFLTQTLGRDRVRFVWVGFQEQFEGAQFQQEIEKLGLRDAVELVPVTSNPHEYFARFDVFAMTSWEDPCPLVVMENMLLETPVACFAPGGGAHEVIGETGIVIPRFDPHAMAQEIAKLLQDETRRQTLGKTARHRVLDLFTARTQVPKIARIISEIVANK